MVRYNASRLMPRWPLLIPVLLVTACSASSPTPSATPSPTLEARILTTATSRPAVMAASTPVATAGPSPTPLIHVVKQGETLLGIAIQYGVELGDLLLSNPDVNPRFLSVGSGLIIPETGAQSAVATATPLPLELSAPRCFADLGGGLWCLTIASGPNSQPVEAVIALITLIDVSGQSLRTEPAFSPVNVLRPDSVLPLAAYFPPPVANFQGASAALASALQASELDERYLQLNITIEAQSISADRLTGRVYGTLRLANPQAQPASGARLVALALDDDAQPVGYRVWETDQLDLLAGGMEFDLVVASFGPPIAELTLLSEAR